MRYMTKEMDGLIEENGTHDSKSGIVTCVQSVIQVTQQQSVIQTTTGSVQPTVLTKGNVILVSKPNSVIQSSQGDYQTLQVVVDANGSEDEDDHGLSPRMVKRRSPMRRRTNNVYPKIESSGSDCDSNLDSELSSHSLSAPSSGRYQLSNDMTNSDPLLDMSPSAGSTGSNPMLHYSQDTQFFVPGEIVVMQNSDGPPVEEQAKKREIRLLKNREAARECRRKKKEYIKCLENRVAVLEAQNKALIDELKSLKELYCSAKNE